MNNNSSGHINGGINKRRLPRKRTLVLIVAGVVAIGLLAAGALYLHNRNVDDNVVCNDKMITQAASLIKDKNSTELSKLSNQAIALPGYDKDVNCLYIAVNASILTGDTKSGKKYYQMLQAVFNPDKGYSSVWGKPTTPPYQLQEMLTFLESSAQQPVQGTFIGTPSQ